MKTIFTILLLASSYISFSRTTGITLPTLYPHFGSSNPTSNMGGSYVRLIGAAKAKFDGSNYIAFDSAFYSYSNGRGGILDLDYTDNFSNFDEKYYYEFNEATGSYNNKSRYLQSFNLLNKILTQTEQDWSYVVNQYQWHNKINLEYVYGNDLSQLIQTKFQLWSTFWWDQTNYKIKYDGKGDITKIEYQLTITNLTYDNNHNIIERLEYDNILGEFTDRFAFTYDISNNITGYIVEKFVNGNWENIDKKEYVITNNKLTGIKSYNWTSGGWLLDRQNIYTYDANDNKLTEEYQTWNATIASFVNKRKDVWTYNQQNQPTTYYSLTWNTSTLNYEPIKGDFYNRYYYEFYSPTSVPKAPSAADLFAVYPIPATNVVNIELKKSAIATYDGYIYDMQGKVVRTFELSNSKETVPVENLPSGNYMIGILYGDKKIAQPLVVAH